MADPVAAPQQKPVAATEPAPAAAAAVASAPAAPVPALRELLQPPERFDLRSRSNVEVARRLVAAPALPALPGLAVPLPLGFFALHQGPAGSTLRAGGVVDFGGPPEVSGQYIGLRLQLDGTRATLAVGIKATPVDGAPGVGTTVAVPITNDSAAKPKQARTKTDD